jgi:oxidase EvaA
MIEEEVKEVLKKNGYAINNDSEIRIKTMIQSIQDNNEFHDLDYILEWFEKKRNESTMILKEIGINELEKWKVSSNTGNISHESGGFFEIIGIKILNSKDREVGNKGWTQPMIAKNPGGILGLIMKRFAGTPHFLLQAKAEPGNIKKLQLSPTLQATKSNLEQEHGGKKPLFAEYFEDTNKSKIIYSKWQSEDGGRFYLKSNLNMIVEVKEDEDFEIPDSFIWITMFQIKQMILHHENLIGPHVRSIISGL